MNNHTVYAVYHLLDAGNTPTKISKELGLKVQEVKDIISSRGSSSTQKNNIKTTSAPVNSKNLMITETAVKGTKSVSIMTKAASEINDDFKKKMPSNVMSRTSKNAIYRPNNKK